MSTYYSPFYPLEGEAGSKGSAAFLGAISTAIIYLYRRSAAALTDVDKPASTLTYAFSTGVLSGTLGLWSKTIPSGSDPLYVVAATATSIDPTDTIGSGEWSSPVILAQNGTSGTSGLSSATVFLFQRKTTSSLPAVPAVDSTYAFSTGVLTGTLGSWSQTVPDSSLGKYLFVTTATAIGYGTTDTITTAEWATVKIMAENGAAGYTAYLTNETHVLPASSVGVVSDYTGATGSFIIYKEGFGDISSSFTLSTFTNTQALTVSYSTNTYTITGGFDSGETVASLTIQATGSGTYEGVTLYKTFTITKSLAGAAGTPAKLLSIATTRQTVTYDGTGAATPAVQTTTFSASKQATTATVNWTIESPPGTVLASPASYLSAITGDTVTMTVAQFAAALAVNGAQSVVVIGTITDGITLSDRITISKLANGSSGSPGASAVSGYLTSESATVFTYADGTPTAFTNIKGNLKVYSGTTDVTSLATSFSATASGCTGTINTADNTPISGQLKGYYQVTAMAGDTATLTLSCVYSGTTITKIYSLTKAKAGYEIVGTLPVTSLFEGRTVYLTADDGTNLGKKLYRYVTGTGWTASVAGGDITAGSITSAQLATTELITVTAQIKDATVTSAKIASLDAGKITAGTITVAVNVGSTGKILMDGANNRIVISD